MWNKKYIINFFIVVALVILIDLILPVPLDFFPALIVILLLRMIVEQLHPSRDLQK